VTSLAPNVLHVPMSPSLPRTPPTFNTFCQASNTGFLHPFSQIFSLHPLKVGPTGNEHLLIRCQAPHRILSDPSDKMLSQSKAIGDVTTSTRAHRRIDVSPEDNLKGISVPRGIRWNPMSHLLHRRVDLRVSKCVTY
jgi:hypothetical protein